MYAVNVLFIVSPILRFVCEMNVRFHFLQAVAARFYSRIERE